VLRCLDLAADQPSITEIARHIEPDNPGAARAAVHGALGRLEELGEVASRKGSHRSRKITSAGRWRLYHLGLRSGHDPRFEPERWRASLPILGRVAGGEPISVEAYADDYADQTLTTSLPLDAREYLLEVDGDSMVYVGIEPGDYLVVRPHRAEETNPYEVVVVAVRLPGGDDVGLTVKRWVPDGDQIRLQSAPVPGGAPADFPAQYYDRSEVEVVAKPVAVIRRLGAWDHWLTFST
jgi:SOS-response transcriptional repressor LexA